MLTMFFSINNTLPFKFDFQFCELQTSTLITDDFLFLTLPKSRMRFKVIGKKETRKLSLAGWWERVDSNHRSQRQQIYSLPPLATRERSHI